MTRSIRNHRLLATAALGALLFALPASTAEQAAPAGAKRRQIIYQFLVETVVLSTTGGLIGLGVGLLIPLLITYFSGMPTVMVVNTDDRAEIPGENRYYNRLAKNDAEFITKWTYGDNQF